MCLVTQCDGGKPCSRCRAQKDIECVYEVPVRQSKEHLRTEIEQLRRHQRSSDSVFAALVRGELWDEILQRLRAGEPVESISDWIGAKMQAGGGPLPAFGRSVSGGGNLTALAGFSGASANSYTPMAAATMGTVSPVSAQPQG